MTQVGTAHRRWVVRAGQVNVVMFESIQRLVSQVFSSESTQGATDDDVRRAVQEFESGNGGV